MLVQVFQLTDGKLIANELEEMGFADGQQFRRECKLDTLDLLDCWVTFDDSGEDPVGEVTIVPGEHKSFALCGGRAYLEPVIIYQDEEGSYFAGEEAFT